MHLVTLIVFFVISLAYGQDRQITATLNPGCKACTEYDILIYVQAKGSKDTIHQIWDFTGGVPTMIFTIGSVNSTLGITWDGRTLRDITLNETAKYSFAAAIDKLIEYDDLDDSGQLKPEHPQESYLLRGMTWQLVDETRSAKEAMVRVRGRYTSVYRYQQGTIDMKLDLLPYVDYAVDLPHLIHTANSTLVDVALVNMTLTPDYNASRFALNVILVSTDAAEQHMHCAMRKSLDDEHTPGVFEIIEIKTPLTYSSQDGGFLQFRPVAYTQAERGVTTSTIVHITDLNKTSLHEHSTLQTFYRAAGPGDLLVESMRVSFGEPGDGYYSQHNYTSWSFTIGYGAPPVEGFSLFVILVISIGLGVPVLLAGSGVVYVLTRRCRRRDLAAHASHARFVDEE